ncbi:F6D8.10 [Salix viminalis]|uniref:F6D8.10 n=1 Tax=Salix viminalis TaxID=40686 RepID=A0A9Q0UGV4_SALVM|nr:F6D8.10 [Salix viminalis]
MANQGHGITYNADELTGQAQARKDDFLNQCEEGCQSSTQDSSYTAQASSFLQQSGEQVKSIAHGAAEAVKNTLGMNTEKYRHQEYMQRPKPPFYKGLRCFFVEHHSLLGEMANCFFTCVVINLFEM